MAGGSAGTMNRRLLKEIQQLSQGEGLTYFQDVTVGENNPYRLTGLLLPEKAPFDRHSFRVELNFPRDYPFKPPMLTFLSRIYHPNVEEGGKMCFSMIAPDTWRPATRIDQVGVNSLLHATFLQQSVASRSS